ncbi:MAG: transporter substrate-binding domain-containing protein [Candidatus Aerophobetes bacterium]|nr:transporter substrate-binding domain-containing protein [Candidatus Aerophobetes bacterium]
MRRSFRLITTVLTVALVLALSGGIFSYAQGEEYIVATSADWPPFEWVDGNGNKVGFDMDVMRAVAITEGYKIEIQDIGFDALVPALKAGKVDILAAGLEITPERAEVLNYSDIYWEIDQSILIHEDSDFNMVTALSRGHKVGAQRGTTQAGWLEDELVKKGIDVKIELYETNDLGIMDLANGRIDAFMADTPAAKAFAKVNPIKIIGSIVPPGGKLVFYVQKGDPKKLLPRLNDGLKKLKGDTWDNLVNAYFAGDLTKITECYAQYSHYLTVEKDVATYAKKLASCMTK